MEHLLSYNKVNGTLTVIHHPLYWCVLLTFRECRASLLGHILNFTSSPVEEQIITVSYAAEMTHYRAGVVLRAKITVNHATEMAHYRAGVVLRAKITVNHATEMTHYRAGTHKNKAYNEVLILHEKQINICTNIPIKKKI